MLKSGVNVASMDQIRVTAYFHWEARGCPLGSALVDWLYAEAAVGHIQNDEVKGGRASAESASIRLPEYLANIHDKEEFVQVKSLELIFGAPEFKAYVNSIHQAQVVLGEIGVHESPTDLQRWVVSGLALRIFNSVASAFRLTIHGYFQTAQMVLRDVVEVSFLLRYFYLDPEKIEAWQHADEKTLKKEFGPSKVRKKSAKLAETLEKGVDEQVEEETMNKMYSRFCREAAHADPRGQQLVYHDGALQFGPIENPEFLKRTLFEIAKWSQFGTLQVIGHLAAGNDDPVLLGHVMEFFKMYGEWIRSASA
jgi:hypothetical protein